MAAGKATSLRPSKQRAGSVALHAHQARPAPCWQPERADGQSPAWLRPNFLLPLLLLLDGAAHGVEAEVVGANARGGAFLMVGSEIQVNGLLILQNDFHNKNVP